MDTTTPTAAVVVVDCDGRTASWDGRDFWGDGQVALYARRAASAGVDVDIFGLVPTKAGSGDAVAAAAALFAFSPGRTVLVDNPPEVTDYLDSALANHGGATR